MKIIALTKYTRSGPSSRYRYYNYIDCFKKNNIEMTVIPFFSDKYLSTSNKFVKFLHILKSYIVRFLVVLRLVLSKKKFDLILIEYELFPYFPSIFEKILKLRNIKYFVDYDDAVFHKYDKHENFIIRGLFKKKISKVMQYAEVVVVGNDYLESYARKFNNNILRLPTVVMLDKYDEVLHHQSSKSNSTFIIGWIGSETTSEYVLTILPAIEKFVSMYDAQCNLIGFDERLLSDSMKIKCRINIIPWSEESEIEEMLKFDIGIMPLPNTAWTKGKCGFKLIQYMSCKKALIASPVGVNTSIVTVGENGFLASTVDDWFIAFKKMYNHENRKIMANNNWNKVNREFNHQIICKQYVEKIISTVEMIK